MYTLIGLGISLICLNVITWTFYQALYELIEILWNYNSLMYLNHVLHLFYHVFILMVSRKMECSESFITYNQDTCASIIMELKSSGISEPEQVIFMPLIYPIP